MESGYIFKIELINVVDGFNVVWEPKRDIGDEYWAARKLMRVEDLLLERREKL